MSWIDAIIRKSNIVRANNAKEQELVDALVNTSLNYADKSIETGIILASFYDLAISAVYYTYITNSGWIYCRNFGNPKLILPFVNCCPVHALNGEFIFHKSSKPTSAKIGEAASRILLLFYQSLFKIHGKTLEVYDACEPADAIFLDKTNSTAFFAEIKASPLLTMSVATDCEILTDFDKDENIVEVAHKSTANPNLIGSEIYIMLPIQSESGKWDFRYYSIGHKQKNNDEDFAYNGILNLLSNQSFLKDYIQYWQTSFRLYCTKDDSENIFWFTNACGKPSGLKDWDGGTTCISDAKTSVGMDRTDDIKKGIYQVLKLGSEGKQISSNWNYKVGILSNIHPARHFESYIKPIKDMVWANSIEKNINFAKDLPSDTPMYNLFDGIITFTESYIRDLWLINNVINSNNNE